MNNLETTLQCHRCNTIIVKDDYNKDYEVCKDCATDIINEEENDWANNRG